MRTIVISVVAAVLTACTGMVGSSGNPDPTKDPGSSSESASVLYPTFGALHEQAVTRTCALNNGVCHDSKMYPDLRTPSGFLASTIGKPCNAQVDKHADFKDACEPPGDHLVIPSMKIDAEIASVAVADPVNSVTITLATSIGTPMIASGMIEVHRDTAVFQFPQIGITSAKDRTVVLDLSKMETYPTNVKKLAQTFFDDRVYPWNDLMVRVADPNANGTLGASLGIKLLVPGDPMKSFVLLRLIDPNQGELMPLACRQWNDAATRALGCWIKGLKVDDKGNALNAEDPIDYASCDFKPDGMGRCSASTATGFAGVQAVFSRSCGGSGCHLNEMTPGGLLDLSEGKALASLVDVPSGQSAMKRVVPGNPDASYIMCKISPDCANRKLERMPKGGLALNPADIEVVRAWIASGAKAE